MGKTFSNVEELFLSSKTQPVSAFPQGVVDNSEGFLRTQQSDNE